MDESEYETLAHLRELERQTYAWNDEAVKAGTIGASYSPDTATIDRLRGYFVAPELHCLPQANNWPARPVWSRLAMNRASVKVVRLP
jgi:hypothetical protein